MSWIQKLRARREQRAFEDKLRADMSAYWTNATLEAARVRAPITPEFFAVTGKTPRPSFDELLFPETASASVTVFTIDLEYDFADLRRLALYTIEPPL